MREAGKPVSAGDVAKMLNADRKEVDKAFAELKKKRCNHLAYTLQMATGRINKKGTVPKVHSPQS